MKARLAFRKTAAFLLTLVLLCGLFPISAHAESSSLWERLFWNAEERSEELTDHAATRDPSDHIVRRGTNQTSKGLWSVHGLFLTQLDAC